LEFHTLDLIVAEVQSVKQRAAVDELVKNGILKVKSLSGKQLETLMLKVDEYHGKCNLSPEDISVMIYAKENGYRLLTGDKILRREAMHENVTVSGIIFLIERMIEKKVVSNYVMVCSLKRMLEMNKRLPVKQINEIIERLS